MNLPIAPQINLPDALMRASRSKMAVSLRYRAFDHIVGQLRLIGTWWLQDGSFDACLVLVRSDLPIRDVKPYVIHEGTAWVWREHFDGTGGDDLAAALAAMDCAESLRLDPMREADVMAILSAVRGRLDDLIHMPRPSGIPKRTVGDLIVRRRGHDGYSGVEIKDNG